MVSLSSPREIESCVSPKEEFNLNTTLSLNETHLETDGFNRQTFTFVREMMRSEVTPTSRTVTGFFGSPETTLRTDLAMQDIHSQSTKGIDRVTVEVDRPDYVNAEDAAYFVKRVAKLKIRGWSRSYSQEVHGHAMVSILSENDNHYLTTARHTLGIDSEDNRTVSASLTTPFDTDGLAVFASSHGDQLRLDKLDISTVYVEKDGKECEQVRNDEDGGKLTWNNGYDVLKTVLDQDLQSLMESIELSSYQVVDQDFTYPIGLRVVILSWGIPSSVSGLENADPEKIRIYTGKVCAVGENHIEYTNNTTTGCSGSPVICIDDQYPAYRYKVIAIHAGHPKDFDRLNIKHNIGTKTRCTHAQSF